MKFNIQTLIRPELRNLKAYSSAREEFTGSARIFLDANESPFGELNRYPDPYQSALKQKLAERKGLEANQIFIGNGSDEIIDLCIRLLCKPGEDRILALSPSYGMYQVTADINNVELVNLPLNEDFQLDRPLLEPLLKDASIKILYLCSPNNPTGNSLYKADIEYVLQNFRGVVFIDEAYIDFAKAESFIRVLNQYPNLIVSQTFSKAWGLAAARLGIAYSSSELIAYLDKIKPPYNVSRLNQAAGLQALSYPEQFEQQVQLILRERAKLVEVLKELKWVQKVYPSDANFILIRVNDAQAVYTYLLEEGIIIRNRHQIIPNCLRISIGNNQENELLIEALKNYA